MKKEDLRLGHVIELRNGWLGLYSAWGIIDLTDALRITFLERYDDSFTYSDHTTKLSVYDIVKVYKDYTLKELLWERKEKPKLTEDEKVILRNLPKGYKYIARDQNMGLYIYLEKPYKITNNWTDHVSSIYGISIFKHLFQFIKWEDEEPYLIEDLLKEDEYE